jgi:hypothetical protein
MVDRMSNDDVEPSLSTLEALRQFVSMIQEAAALLTATKVSRIAAMESG